MTLMSWWHDAIREDCACSRYFRSLAVAIEVDDPPIPRQIARGGTFASWHTQAGLAAGMPIASLACTSRSSSS